MNASGGMPPERNALQAARMQSEAKREQQRRCLAVVNQLSA
jgi:hypothetical protein